MTDSPPPRPRDIMRNNANLIMEAVPWARHLGFELIEIGDGRATASVNWREDLVGDPDTGVIAGGVITALLDNLCGVATGAALEEYKSMATVDLRIDYMRPATKGETVFAEAECYHLTRSIAFCRASAYHGEKDRMIATAAATFALNDISRWKGGAVAAAAEKAGIKT